MMMAIVRSLTEIDESPHCQPDKVLVQIRIFNHQLQGCAGHYRQEAPWCATFPMVPGIDLAGEVRLEKVPIADFSTGDKVLLNGYGVGEAHWGGLAQKAVLERRVADQAARRVLQHRDVMAELAPLATRQCCVCWRLKSQGITPSSGEILVTGATGGVGVGGGGHCSAGNAWL